MTQLTQVSPSKRYRLILSAVHMVYRLVNSTYSVAELTLRLTRLLCQFIHASSAHVYLLDDDKKKIGLIASFDNQINILRQKPKELQDIPSDVMKVTRGASVFEGHVIGLPLIADDYLGAIFIRRNASDPAFGDFEREMLSVFAEQAVTAIKNLQLNQQHEKIILGSIQSIGNLLKKQQHLGVNHPPAYTMVTRMIAERMNVSTDGVKSLEYAAQLHDVGVIDIPYEILSKREALTPQEFKIIRHHTVRSVALIKSVAFLKPILPIILYHHEKYDGTGYPSGLKKEQIPLGARIIAVVDAFEAMVQGRPYRDALTVDEAVAELIRYRATQFDPRVVDIFARLSRQKNFRKYLALLKR